MSMNHFIQERGKFLTDVKVIQKKIKIYFFADAAGVYA
jgi:hypothetical protein